MTTQTQPVEEIAVRASSRYSIAKLLKSKGDYMKAFEYFRKAAMAYERLVTHEDVPVSKRLGYLERQRECLESMLVDAFTFNLPLWANIKLKIKEVDGHSRRKN